MRKISRRTFLKNTRDAGAAAAVAGVSLPVAATGRGAGILSARGRQTLDAALARVIPAVGADDWSAASLGAGRYIERLLAGPRNLYAGGPYRGRFGRFWRPTRAKRVGWSRELRRLRRLYRDGLLELDERAGGDFAARPAPIQDAILTSLDLEGSPFFSILYDHAMEGVYSHPIYGGNRGYRAWKEFGYAGDVHGVRFPERGSSGPWDEYGGYSPEEMGEPGEGP